MLLVTPIFISRSVLLSMIAATKPQSKGGGGSSGSTVLNNENARDKKDGLPHDSLESCGGTYIVLTHPTNGILWMIPYVSFRINIM